MDRSRCIALGTIVLVAIVLGAYSWLTSSMVMKVLVRCMCDLFAETEILDLSILLQDNKSSKGMSITELGNSAVFIYFS
jgi:hypothetical protein